MNFCERMDLIFSELLVYAWLVIDGVFIYVGERRQFLEEVCLLMGEQQII